MTMISDALYPLLSTFPSFVDLFLSSKHLSLDLSACKDNDAPPCWANGIGHSTMERLLGSRVGLAAAAKGGGWNVDVKGVGRRIILSFCPDSQKVCQAAGTGCPAGYKGSVVQTATRIIPTTKVLLSRHQSHALRVKLLVSTMLQVARRGHSSKVPEVVASRLVKSVSQSSSRSILAPL